MTKKIFTAVISLLFLSAHAQETTPTKPSLYAATGLCISNSYDTTLPIVLFV